MLGRRSYARVSTQSAADGVLTVSRDISVRMSVTGEIVAIGREAAAVGERVRVALADREIDAEVIESRPIVSDGAVRRRLLMRPCDRDRFPDVDNTERAR